MQWKSIFLWFCQEPISQWSFTAFSQHNGPQILPNWFIAKSMCYHSKTSKRKWVKLWRNHVSCAFTSAPLPPRIVGSRHALCFRPITVVATYHCTMYIIWRHKYVCGTGTGWGVPQYRLGLGDAPFTYHFSLGSSFYMMMMCVAHNTQKLYQNMYQNIYQSTAWLQRNSQNPSCL